MIKRVRLLITLFFLLTCNVYGSNSEKLITNIDTVYENFRNIQNTYKQDSIIEAIRYYDKYFVQSYQFLNKKDIDKTKLLSQMLEDEKSFSEGDELLQEIPTDIANFLYIYPLKNLSFLFINELNASLKDNILSPVIDLKKAVDIDFEYTGKYKESTINAYLSGYLLFIYSRFVYNYNINNYIEDYSNNLNKYKKYISKKYYNLYLNTINLLGQ